MSFLGYDCGKERNAMDKEIDLLKDKLARACRMLEKMGLIDHSGHISGRMPGSQTFFIHPQQLSREEVTPGDMAEVTLKGEWVGGRMNPPSESPIHAAVYQARPDVNCVVHVHTHFSILPSIVGVDLVPVCQHGAIFGSVVPVYDDSEKIDDFEKASGLARALGTSRAVIMRGHGAVIADATVEAGFVASFHLEENAKLFVQASILGKPIPLSKEETKRAGANSFKPSSIQKAWSYFMEKGRKAHVFWD
jgi:HCOMODA/2-hydroxy-3-carboxy-muconic semialdehyde decarboxylase